MEISEYLTNVLSINDLSSIYYYYLEFCAGSKAEQTTLLDIEAAWRKLGALTVQHKSGIWVFGKDGDPKQVLPSTVTINIEGFIEFHDDLLAIKHQGAFDPTNIWKPSKPLTTTLGAPTGATSPSFSTDSSTRNLQALNVKASHCNAAIGLKKENGSEPSPIQGEFSAIELVFSPRDIQEHFISAILGTLSYHLCQDSGFIPLNARTLVLLSSGCSGVGLNGSQTTEEILYHEKIWLITLDVHLTSLGMLLVKAWPNLPFNFSWTLGPRHGLNLSKSLVDGTTLFLAPSGRVARYCGSSMSDVSGNMQDVVGTPKEKYPNGTPSHEHSLTRWKQRCLSWLASKGMRIDVEESGGWFTVQVHSQLSPSSPTDIGDTGPWTPTETLVTITWPAVLCFKRRASDMDDTLASKKSPSHDPLSFAEGWFRAKTIRKAAVAKRRKERESEAAALQAQVEVEARNLLSSNFSPAGLRRASLAGAVYPTPPDGIQPAIGATPSFDGNGSTPGQPNTQNMVVESENVAVPKGEREDTNGNSWDLGETKRDQIGNSGLDFNDENNNFYGDMGGDLFGENDITDADFSFFDEPDPIENTQDNTANDETFLENVKVGTSEQNTVGDISTSNVISDGELDVAMAEADLDKTIRAANGEVAADQVTQVGVDTCTEHDPSEPQIHVSTRKGPSPPLSPDLIFKKLSTVGNVPGDSREPKSLYRDVGTFGGVSFDPSIFTFNKKYDAQGRFMYPSISKSSDQLISNSLPRTGYLSKIRKRRTTTAKISSQTFVTSHEALNSDLEIDDNPSDLGSPSFSHPVSPISDQDDTSTSTGDGLLLYSPGLKRKRGSNDIGDDDEVEDEMSSSFQGLNVDNTRYPQPLDPLRLLDHGLLDTDPADWSLTSFLSSPEPRHLTRSLSDTEYIASAQVLADQAISRTLHIPLLTDNLAISHAGNGIDCYGIITLVQQKLLHAAKSCFGRAVECSMAAYVDIQDLLQSGPGNRMTSRPTPISRIPHTSEPTKPNAIFNLTAPHLEVQRSESKLTVLPPAIPFWENLGLAPCRGSKDITAICIYPDGEGLAESVEAFLEQIRNAYESSRLGSHERFSHADLVDGHVPMDFGDSALMSVADHQHVLSKIQETSAKVGPLLAAGPISETNLVIYYAYDSESPELLVPICSAFHELFEFYKESLDNEKRQASNELVFQLVPMNFIASNTSIVVPPPTDYMRLAMEVYDRCVDLNTGTSVPSIILEQPLPRAIDFKLTRSPSASPLQENSCMHVAYAQSLDDRWITAAWTDNTGAKQMTASYCLGRRNCPLTASFPNIAREIWETTLGIIAPQGVNWRILIAKSGVMEPSEIEFWQSLASESHQSLAARESYTQISLTLITVNTNPSLELLPPSISVAPNVLATQSSLYTTPVSTPQASIFSPEPGSVSTPTRDSGPANAPTPNDSNADLKIDADATLVDIADQTWGVILSHRLNNSRSLLEFHPALISGYLIKRSSAAASDVPIVIEVNIVHSEAHPRMYEPLLREILGLYRGFATLARVRGCVDPATDGRPWHIAAVEKGVQALYILM